MDAKEREEYRVKFLAEVDWDTYDYKTSPGADMRFPDFTEAELPHKVPWVAKHYNTTSQWNVCHVADLNQIQDGETRRLLALYGVPVEWPRRSEDAEALDELIDELDRARAEGGARWASALDAHGLLNDEHYDWMRGRSLGFPDSLSDYEKAREAITLIEQARQGGEAATVMKYHGFRDEAHYAWCKQQLDKAKDQAWAQHNVLLQQTAKALEDRFEKNKEALTGELAPYRGVSMDDWAAANVALVQGLPLENILGVLGIERPQWDEVNAEWTGRMSRDTTATIATVYGQAFTAGPGRFAAGAKGAQVAAGTGDKGADPISFEEWIKIQSHITAASAQGVDVGSVLAQYQLNAAEWGTIGGQWATKMSSNPMEYMEKYQALSAKYASAFASGAAGSDIEF
jgi:hypothetical protein